MRALVLARSYVLSFPRRLHLGAFKSLIQPAVFLLDSRMGFAGRPFLAAALLLVWPSNGPYRYINQIVRQRPRAFRDPRTQAILFRDRWYCRDLGATLRATFDFSSGDLDRYVDSAKRVYERENPSNAAKFHWLQRAHILGDTEIMQTFLSKHALDDHISPANEARLAYLAGPGSERTWHRTRFERRLKQLGKSWSKPKLRDVLDLTKWAIEAEDFETAKLLLEHQLSPIKHLFHRHSLEADYETMAIHLHLAVNRFFGSNAETNFLHPDHFQTLRERGQKREHPLLGTLRSELVYFRSSSFIKQDPSVALFCPVHRAADVPKTLSQAAHQTIPNSKTYLVLNNLDQAVSRESILAAWPDNRVLEILDFGDMPGIGSVIVRALKEVDEQFFLKLDSDCAYGPNYAQDMVMHCLMRGADIAVKRTKFLYFSDIGIMDLQSIDCANRWYQENDWAGGSAICAPTDIWRRYAVSSLARLGEDTAFLRAAKFNGKQIFLADPFSHISVRRSDGKDHTFVESHIRLGAVRGSYSVCLDDVDLRKFAFA